MRHSTRARVIAGAAALVVAAAASLVTPVAGVVRAGGPIAWTYPGCAVEQGRVPSPDTLQDCITGANAGDSVEITTNAPIAEAAVISKSLTLFGSPGFHPSVNAVVAFSSAGTIAVTVRHLTVADLVEGRFTGGSGHSLTLDDITITPGDTGFPAVVDLEASVPASFTITHSTLDYTGSFTAGILLDGHQASGLVTLTAIGDRISGLGNPSSGSGIELDLTGGGTTRANLLNDSIWKADGCTCGASAGISLYPQDTTTLDANVVGVTVDHSFGDGLYVRNSVGSGGGVSLDVFDSVFSNESGSGIDLDSDTGAAPRLALRAGNNDLRANGRANILEGRSPGSGNLALDPRYVGAASGDLRLSATSPLIDRGVVCSPGGVANLDAAGDARLHGASVDIGAYERGAGAPTGVARVGTTGPDTLIGTPGADILCGLGGNDKVQGLGGNDYLGGGKGNDVLIGGPGADRLVGGPGNDTLCAKDGVKGNDAVDGGPGTDGYRADPGDHLTNVERAAICP